MNKLTFLSAATMARQIREKKISPVDLVEADLAKIERLNPKLNAYLRQTLRHNDLVGRIVFSYYSAFRSRRVT